MATEKLKRLMEKRDALNARIRQEDARRKATERKSDTRRKILAGALALEWAEEDKDFAAEFRAKLERFLVRDADRALFDLTPARQEKAV